MLKHAEKKAGWSRRPCPRRSPGGRGGDADLHHEAGQSWEEELERGTEGCLQHAQESSETRPLPIPPRFAPSRILVDDPAIVPELRAVFPDTLMHHRPEVEWPVELDAVFDQALAGAVALGSGGSVHIEATRAAVLIDVDS